RPGGLLAAAIADAFEGVVDADSEPPPPDMREIAGVVYASRPVGVRAEPGGAVIERVRGRVSPSGEREQGFDEIRLDAVSAADLAAEAAPLGFTAEEPREIPQTEDYVGSTVVMLRA